MDRYQSRCVVLPDGYLSNDEKVYEEDGDDGEKDGDRQEVLDFSHMEAAPMMELDQPTTNLLNALLAAKKAAQPLLICRNMGAHIVYMHLPWCDSTVNV